MEKIKKILAFAGIILLLGLYLMSLFLALTASPHATDAFVASVASTVIIPILIWIYLTLYRIFKERKKK